jgi:hypothetical protein
MAILDTLLFLDMIRHESPEFRFFLDKNRFCPLQILADKTHLLSLCGGVSEFVCLCCVFVSLFKPSKYGEF